MSIQGTPVAGIRWLVDSDGAVVGYRNPVTDQDAIAQVGNAADYLGPQTMAALQAGAYADGTPELAALAKDTVVYLTDRGHAVTPTADGTHWSTGASGDRYTPAELAALATPLRAGTLVADPTTGIVYGQSDGSGGYEPLGGGAAVSDGYVCHFYAPLACDSDTKARDISGALNDGSFQANLSAATAWATAGFLTQPNPSVSGELSLVQFPAVSWDWSAGDCLFVFWMGRGTPEGSDAPMFGDSAGAGLRSGFKIMATPGGNVKIIVYQNPSTTVSGPTSGAVVVASSATHSFAICVVSDGGMCYWSDGVRNAGHIAGYLKPSGAPISTINAAPVYLGGDGYAPGGVQNGMALQTRALVVLKGRRNNIPTVESMDALVAALHRNPQALVSADAW